MTTARQIEANRANARKSTGPRMASGKARASRNARRHGLSIPVLADPEVAMQVEELACQIVGDSQNPSRLQHALIFAEANFDIARIRRARCELFSEQGDPGHEAVGVQKKGGTGATEGVAANLTNRLRLLARFDCYERRALSRRESATRNFDAAGPEAD
jgi:hypothetical protein